MDLAPATEHFLQHPGFQVTSTCVALWVKLNNCTGYSATYIEN